MAAAEMEKRTLPQRSGGGGDLVERLPQTLILEIIEKLDLDSLCSLAPVCRSLRSSVALALASISALDLSSFSPPVEILKQVLRDNKVLLSLTLDCSRLNDSDIDIFTKESIRELTLLRCAMFSSYIFIAVGASCPNLRLFALEIGASQASGFSNQYPKNIQHILKGCLSLESLSIKFQVEVPGPGDHLLIQKQLPKTIKALLLLPITDSQARHLILDNGSDASYIASSPFSSQSITCGIQSLTLVLNRITDNLLFSITNNLPQLVELCLEDKPSEQQILNDDLTNSGLQALCTCRSLICLSLSRTRKNNSQSTFRRVNDVGILLLAEGCKGLESIRLGGFFRVTDAGYTSLIHCCKNLKKIEFVNAYSLTDLTFHDLADAPSSLMEVRLVSCNLVTSEAAVSISSSRNLQVLDLSGCKSIADVGLNAISKLSKLTTLDLGGADITDSSLVALGDSNSPIVSLCLRGCKRITDKGIIRMLHGNGVISKTLSTLDLGHLPGVSDRAIFAVADVCMEMTNLCTRNCFFITDASVNALGSLERSGGRRPLRKLDLYNCCGLSSASFRFMAQPFFRGLRWLGVGNTRLLAKGEGRLMDFVRERPELTVCSSGCEIGCKDGWQYHDCF